MVATPFFVKLRGAPAVPPGTRIRLRPAPGSRRLGRAPCGTVQRGSNGARLQVRWDDGRTRSLLPAVEEFDVVGSDGCD